MPDARFGGDTAIIETDVPARLDRLPWTRFHTLVVIALGITWVLDGLEVTIAGSIVGALRDSPVLHFSEAEIGLVASAYLGGAVGGALLFGYLTDRLGRRKLFMVTLGLYLTATAATAFAWDFWSFALFRVLTGAGIGGEYAAINSAIQELIPARYRGRTDLAVNGSFWVGAALGAVGAVVLLQPGLLPPDWGWRSAFGIGAVLGLSILVLRRWIPESPRWLMLHGRVAEADAVLAGIERHIAATTDIAPLPEDHPRLRIVSGEHTPVMRIIRAILLDYPRRAVLGLVLMAAQAFFYNAIFFSYALVLGRFYGVPSQAIGWYMLPFALGNFLGPLLLGPLFDTIGRRKMIAFTYAISGVLLAIVGFLFRASMLDAVALTVCWSVHFLLCLGRRERRLSDGQREFPARSAGAGDSVFLRGRHRDRRGRLALSVRDAGRQRRARRGAARLSVRRGADDRGGSGRAGDRGQCGATIARTGRPAAVAGRNLSGYGPYGRSIPVRAGNAPISGAAPARSMPRRSITASSRPAIRLMAPPASRVGERLDKQRVLLQAAPADRVGAAARARRLSSRCERRGNHGGLSRSVLRAT